MKNYKKQIGKSRGHFTTTENRIQKLVDNWLPLKEKLEGMLERGKGRTETSRYAFATLLIMETGIRVGNESSAEGYTSINKYSKHFNKVVKTYGVTTILKKHVKINSSQTVYNFLGKKQVKQVLESKNKILQKWILTITSNRRPNETLLDIDYYSLSKFIKKYIGKNFKPKDLRQAFVNLQFINVVTGKDYTSCYIETKAKVNKTLRNEIEETAEVVGHTLAVCRKSYITPSLLNFHKNELLSMYKTHKQNK